jgi:hypothetical protein
MRQIANRSDSYFGYYSYYQPALQWGGLVGVQQATAGVNPM